MNVALLDFVSVSCTVHLCVCVCCSEVCTIFVCIRLCISTEHLDGSFRITCFMAMPLFLLLCEYNIMCSFSMYNYLTTCLA